MKKKLTTLIADSGFEFEPGFSGRVMNKLKQTIHLKDASVVLTENISRLFYWVNIPVMAALLVIALLFFLNIYRSGNTWDSSDQVNLNEYVYDFYVSNN